MAALFSLSTAFTPPTTCSDAVVGVSECIIMGIPIPLGTGLFKLLQRVPKVALPKSEPLLFPTKRAGK